MLTLTYSFNFFFFQAEDGIRDIGVTGVQTCALPISIKSDGLQKHIPVVMLTSSREERDVLRSYEIGVNAFVVKPVDFNAFFEAIQDLGMFWAVLNEPPPRGAHGE